MSKRTGCAARLPQLIIIIVGASLLAAGIWLGVSYLQRRPQYPEGTFPVTVAGRQVLVAMDPAQEVMLVQTSIPAAPGTGGQTVVQLPTGTPAVLPTAQPTGTIQILPTPGPTVAATATLRPRPSCVIFTSYTVQAGDTLFGITRKYVTSIALMASHGISSASLTPGAVLRLPIGDPSCCQAGWRPYAVEAGESWFGIARACGVTVDTLLQGNGLPAGSTLYMATVICVPQN
jgi:LysM repeat protein